MLVVLLSILANMEAHQVLHFDRDDMLRYIQVSYVGLRQHVTEVLPAYV